MIKKLIHLAWPMALLQCAQLGMGTVDTFVSSRVSIDALAGVALGTAIGSPIILCVMMIVSALTPLAASHHARGETQKALFLLSQSRWIALLVSGIACACLSSAPLWMHIMTPNSVIAHIASQYLVLASPSVVFAAFYQIFRSHFEAQHYVRISMITTLLGFFIHIPLDTVCVLGIGGWQGMGGPGCGLATSLGFFSMWLLQYMYYRHQSSSTRITHTRINFIACKQLLALGLPMGAATFMEIGMFSVVTVFIAAYGEDVLAAHQIVMAITSLIFILPFSVSNALTILVAHEKEIGTTRSMKRLLLSGGGLGMACILSTSSVLLLAPTFLPSLFTHDTHVMYNAACLLMIAAVYQWVDAGQVLLIGMLRGFHDTRYPFIVMTIGSWCVSIPVGIALSRVMTASPLSSAMGFYIGLLVALIMVCAVLIKRLQRQVSHAPMMCCVAATT